MHAVQDVTHTHTHTHTHILPTQLKTVNGKFEKDAGKYRAQLSLFRFPAMVNTDTFKQLE